MTVSIIIAVKTWQKNLEECAAKCLALDYPDFEIIILPDKLGTATSFCPYLIIPTGPVSPARKRDIALEHAKGEILAFIDDDAYPDKNWLTYAVENFKDESVAAVGGPAITPPSDSMRQIASGAVYASRIVSGNFVYRYLPGKRIQVEDYPSCNLLVRKSAIMELGGFDTNFWPGEDTKLCLDITKKLGKKIIYDPRVIVWHHRRPLFQAHLKQIVSYSLHRGYFVKRYPETSLKLAYFIPSIFLIGIIFGFVLSLYSTFFKETYLLGLSIYLIIAVFFSFAALRKVPKALKRTENFQFVVDVFIGIILTHLFYGFYFLKGLLLIKLKEEAQ